MDTEFEETIEEEQDPAIKRPALISDPVVGRVSDQERYERRRATIERSRRLFKVGSQVLKTLRTDTNGEDGGSHDFNRIKNNVEEVRKSLHDKKAIQAITGRVVDRLGVQSEVNELTSTYTKGRRGAEKIKSELTKKIEQINSESFQKRNRITFTVSFLMIGTAVLFDTIQVILNFIPIVGWILSFLTGGFAWLTFYVWTSIMGWGASDTIRQVGGKFLLKTKSGQKFMKWVVSFSPIAELVPILNTLPVWTVRVLIQISILKAEDATYNASHGQIDLEQIAKLADKYLPYTE